MTLRQRSTALERFIKEIGLTEEELAYWANYELKGQLSLGDRIWTAPDS